MKNTQKEIFYWDKFTSKIAKIMNTKFTNDTFAVLWKKIIIVIRTIYNNLNFFFLLEYV